MKLVEVTSTQFAGDFACRDKDLTTLEGVLRSVAGTEITSVGGSFNCNNNKLTSLKGCPKIVGGDFFCSNNLLTSLEGAPEIIGVDFFCTFNNLTSLEGIHKIIKEINGGFYARKNPIKSHVLGLLLIKGLKQIRLGFSTFTDEFSEVQTILNKHLPNNIGNKGVLACQSDLLDAGLDDFAQL
jgi:hypothetical protein